MTSFPPIDPATVEAISATFEKVSTVVMGFIGLVVVARFSLLALQVGSVDQYASVVRDAVMVLITIALFPYLLKISVSTVAELAAKFEFRAMEMPQGAINQVLEEMMKSEYGLAFIIKMTALGLNYFVRGCFTLLLAILCSAIPLILLIEFIFGARIGVATLGSTILALLCWPILWNLIGLLAIQIAPTVTETSLAAITFSVLVHIVQFASPLFCFALIKTAAPHAAAKTFAQLPMMKAGKLAKKAM